MPSYNQEYIATTLYVIHLVNIKFEELEHNANWWTFGLANKMPLSVDCLTNTHSTRDYN